jgi:sigma-B regulation protein RsbU (phosphoserine phosphatase)
MSDPGRPDWRRRLAEVVETMREMSLQTDPQAMVSAYGRRMRAAVGSDRTLSLSRRNLERPRLRVTRDSQWTTRIDPWKETDKLPMIEGGMMAELIYGNEPRIIDGTEVGADDPGAAYLREYRTVVALPHYDAGEGLNMVLLMWRRPGALDVERLPETMQMSSLFGRVTGNLVLKTRLEEAYKAIDRELEVVAEIQRSLLPHTLPRIPGVTLAASYQTSKQAGGDYYDLFALPDGRWGILIADVSGHGTPAAVVMAITHAISHSFPGPPMPPGALLTYVNQALATRYTTDSGNFVTAFYGIFDPGTRELVYSSAGHNPPRLRRPDGSVAGLDAARSVPLGILPGEQYSQHSVRLGRGESVLFYTDGITEAWSAAGEMFGTERLDRLLGGAGGGSAEGLIRDVLAGIEGFSKGRPADDDRTLLGMCVD